MSIISWGFLTTLFLVTAIAWLGSWAIRHRRRRSLLAAAIAFALLLSLASTADAVNAHYQYLPRVADVVGGHTWPVASRAELQQLRATSEQAAGPVRLATSRSAKSQSVTGQPAISSHGRRSSTARPHPLGAVVSIPVDDNGVGFAAGSALIYLPPQYFTELTARFPTVYLLHGSPGVPIDWLRGADAAQAGLREARAGHPQILVMPHVSRNWLDDSECVDGAHTLAETYVVRDLVPDVDARLRTMSDAAHRTVGGMSAGGYCALNIGLRHRDIFGSIIDMSGFTHPTHAGGMAALFGRRPDLAQLVAANSPDRYVGQLAAKPATRVYLLCGTHDAGPLAQLASIRDRLRARGVSVTWVTRPGGHTFGVWRPGLAAALVWTPR